MDDDQDNAQQTASAFSSHSALCKTLKRRGEGLMFQMERFEPDYRPGAVATSLIADINETQESQGG